MAALADYFGILDEDTAASLEEIVERRREERTRAYRDRAEDLDEPPF